eukprot:944257-Prorocentrum_minimum.AAC.6
MSHPGGRRPGACLDGMCAGTSGHTLENTLTGASPSPTRALFPLHIVPTPPFGSTRTLGDDADTKGDDADTTKGDDADTKDDCTQPRMHRCHRCGI